MNELKILESNANTISSLEVAEMLAKEHKHLLRDIKVYIQQLGETKIGLSSFFIKDTYQTSQNKALLCYQLTKKGCEFVAHKLTGAKGALFTAEYIERFHEMEGEIKMKFSGLSPQLQVLINIEKRLNKNDIEIENVRQEVEGIRDVVALNPIEWRKETTAMINKIAKTQGGTEKIRETRNESYNQLEKRFGVCLGIRLRNKQNRMVKTGVCHSKIDRLSFLDVIQEDKKLIEGYIIIVKDMAIKYGVHQWAK